MAAENNIVGEVGLIVKPLDHLVDPGIKKIINQIEAMKAQTKVDLDTIQAQRSVDQLTQGANNLSESFTQSALSVAGITTAVYALKTGMEKVVNTFSGLFDQLAQARAGFTSILKSPQSANTLLAQIQEFARVSPFVTQELVNYSQQLLGVGMAANNVLPLLKNVGNIISSVGGDTQNMGRVLFYMTQIQSMGKLVGRDAMQLQMQLIPITKYLSEYLHKSTAEVQKMKEAGQITADMTFAAIAQAGQKVSGAMDKATRNIGGAKAILSDTFKIMLQKSPDLQKIFDDIWHSIIKLSNFIGRDDVSAGITSFLHEIGRVYEGFKPLMQAITSVAGSTGLSMMKAVTSVLSAFATVLNAIPQSVLKVLANFIVGISAIKTPLMILQYAMRLENLATGALHAGVNIQRMTLGLKEQASAAEQAAAANMIYDKSLMGGAVPGRPMGMLERMNKKGLSAQTVGMGLAAASTFIGDGKGGERDAVGNIAQFAGMGAMVGGPWGLAAGAAVGAFTSIISASHNAKVKLEADAKAAAASWAGDTVRTILNATGGTANEKNLPQFLKEADKGEALIRNYTHTLDNLAFKQREVTTSARYQNAEYRRLGDVMKDVKGSISQLQKEQDALFADPAFKDYLDKVTGSLAIVASIAPDQFDTTKRNGAKTRLAGTPAFKDQTDLLTGQRSIKNSQDAAAVAAQLKTVGLTMDDLANKSKDEIASMVELYTHIPDKIRDVIAAQTAWNTALKEAKTMAATIFGPEKEQLTSLNTMAKNAQDAMDAQIKAAQNLNDASAQREAQIAILTVKEDAYSTAKANGASEASALAQAEVAAANAARFHAQAVVGAAADTRFNNDQIINQLLKLSGLEDNIANRKLVVDVATQGVEKVMAQIAALQLAMLALENGKLSDFGPNKNIAGAEKRQALGDTQQQLAAAKKQLADLASGKGDTSTAQAIKDAYDKQNTAANTWADKVTSATDAMTNAVQSASDAITAAAKGWESSIKERTQYEKAVSVGGLIRNTTRQVSDINELASGIANLKQRGVSQQVLDALDINNVADLKQVRKLVRASDADLMSLTQGVSTLDSSAMKLAQTAEDKRTQDNITKAIIAAAKTLGIKGIDGAKAASISNQFTITPGANAEDLAMQILNLLTSGRISR